MSKQRSTNKVLSVPEVRPAPPLPGLVFFRPEVAVFAGALLIAFILYGPALGGPFLFDDIGLPFYQPGFRHDSLAAWISGVRPLLMLSYWGNYQISGRDPWTYHALNVVLHACNTYLVYALSSRILSLSAVERGRARFSGLVGAGIFLVHPLQTESVAYIAARSELVCGLFTLAALVVFCGRGPAQVMSWKRAAAVIALYGGAVLSKEQAAGLPVLLLLLDMLLWKQPATVALRNGAWLYGPLAIAGGLALAGVAVVLAGSATAGFQVPGMQWYEYLFTQFRVWLMYVGLAVFPVWQNADYDLSLSRTLWDNGAWLAVLVLIVAAVSVVRSRGRFPLLFCGCLMFAVLLAPTSSVIPLRDLAAERRMYLPLAGLLLAGLQFLTRAKMGPVASAALPVVLLVFSALTHERARIWASDIALWTDVTRAAPQKVRGHTQLAYAYMRAGRCADALEAARVAPGVVREDALFMATVGQAYGCERRWPEAAEAVERAVLLEPSVGRMLALASIYRRANRDDDAGATEQQALKFPPRSPYDHTMLQAFNGVRSRSDDRNWQSSN